jgi:ABC-2 type transport system permease protein
MNKILASAQKEIAFLFSTPAVLLVLMVAPLIYPFMYNFLYVNKIETKIPLSVVDLDRSAASRDFIRRLSAAQQVRVIGIGADFSDVQGKIESGAAGGVIIIPKSYERKLLRHERPVLRAFFNTTGFMIAVDAGKGLGEAIAQINKDLLIKSFSQSGLSDETALRLAEPLSLRSEAMANTVESYGDFIIPALLLLILQQSLFVGTAMASARMSKAGRRKGFLEIVEATIGRALPYFVLYSVYAGSFFTVQYRIWKIPFSGSAGVLAALIAVHLLTIIAAGFFIGSLCKSRLTALFIGMFSSYPMFLLSGLAWPLQAMPKYLQLLSHALPATQFFPAALAAARLKAGWRDVQAPFIYLSTMFLAFSIALLFLKIRLRPNA